MHKLLILMGIYMLAGSLTFNALQYSRMGKLSDARESDLTQLRGTRSNLDVCLHNYDRLNLVMLRAYDKALSACGQVAGEKYTVSECIDAMAWDRVWIEQVHHAR